MKYEDGLIAVVYSHIQRGEYPTPEPTIEDQIKDKRTEIKNLQKGIGRPSTKSDYLSLLDQKQFELGALIVENDEIKARNVSAKKAVDDKYQSDIAAGMLSEDYQWEALRNCADFQLRDTSWWMLPDASLNEAQSAQATTWRTDMMTLNQYDIEDAIAEYDSLIENKPEWRLW
jgi:hypothetical protein